MGNARYPVRVWLGRYQAWMLTLYGKRCFRRDAATVEKFFEASAHTYLSQFKSADIDDYAIGLKRSGKAAATVAIELSRIRRFWKWAIQDRGLKLLEPVSPVHKRVLALSNKHPKTKRLSPIELSRLLERIKLQPELVIQYLYNEIGKTLIVKAEGQCDTLRNIEAASWKVNGGTVISNRTGNALMRQLVSQEEPSPAP